jgi:hypothetical protein
MFILVSCGGNTNSKAYIGAEAGPIDIKLELDSEGHISIAGDFAPKVEIGLGPIELKAGIEETLDLTKDEPYTLFIIWEDETGEVHREEYEIGKPFKVTFVDKEYIQEIQGDNNSVIVVVEKSSDETNNVISVTPTNSISTDMQSYWCDDLSLIRLKVGDNAVIAWDTVNLRSSPEVPADWKSNRISVLDKGAAVEIIGGPKCANNGTWWYVQTDDGSKGWIREYASQGYLLAPS